MTIGNKLKCLIPFYYWKEGGIRGCQTLRSTVSMLSSVIALAIPLAYSVGAVTTGEVNPIEISRSFERSAVAKKEFKRIVNIDSNGDGQISLQEASDFYKMIGRNPSEIRYENADNFVRFLSTETRERAIKKYSKLEKE